MEFVLTVPRDRLFRECYPQGFVPFGEGFRREELEEAVGRDGFFVEREHAERTPTLKQIIPYTVVMRVPDGVSSGGEDEVLVLRRLARGGEARLHGKLSIGVGGHIDPTDAAEASSLSREQHAIRRGRSILAAATLRELEEELVLAASDRPQPNPNTFPTTARKDEIPRAMSSQEPRGPVLPRGVAGSLTPVGLLNDDSNSVGAVHVGLVQILWVAGDVRIREEDVLEGRFRAAATLAERLEDGDPFETWSAVLIRSFLGRVAERGIASALSAPSPG